MILRSLRLRHFGPFFGECVVDLSPAREASDRPICLIGALNGSGKTSLLDAVVLALYGPRARCSSRGDLSWKDFLYRARNSLAPDAETSEISLTFDYPTAEGTTRYRLVRAWWHTPTSVAESLEVYTQGEGDAERLDHELTETWAERVEDLVPLGVSNLFFFDGEQVRALATSDDTTPEVRGAIRTLLGLELPDRLSRDLTIIVQRKLKELGGDEALVAATDLERELARLLAAQQLIEAERAAVSAKVEQARRQLGAERERFVASGGELAAARATLEQQLGRALARVDAERTRLRELAGGPLPFALVAPLLERALKRARAELHHVESEELIGKLEERDEATLAILRTHRLDKKSLNTLRDVLADDRERRAAPLDGAPYLLAPREAVHNMAALAAEQLPAQRGAAAQVLSTLNQARGEVERLQGQLSAAAAPEDAVTLLTRLESANHQLAALEAVARGLDERAASLDLELRRAQTELDRKLRAATDARQASQASRRVMSAAERVQGVLTAFQERLKKKKLDALEDLVTERFQHLARKRDLVERVEIDADSFRLTLYAPDGRIIDKSRLSAGEQQILAVAFLWALSLASGRNLPVVIDTPLSRMDSAHRKNLVERYFPHASHQVILLSTDSEIDQSYHTKLNALGALDRCYLLEFDSVARTSKIRPGYFWE